MNERGATEKKMRMNKKEDSISFTKKIYKFVDFAVAAGYLLLKSEMRDKYYK